MKITDETDDDIVNKKDGLINFNGFVFWNKAKIVKPYVKQYLREKFPNSLIIRELNQIDLVDLNENLPIEIQSTPSSNIGIKNSYFEDLIRRQIEDNIENYERCWFFFDSEYYRYLKDTIHDKLSMNLDWFAKYVKENKLKVFTVKYDGIINELNYEDIGFIKKVSNTCKIEYNEDSRILNRNKLKIMNNILKGHKFTQEEIDRFIADFDNRENESNNNLCQFLTKEKDKRKQIYGYVLQALGNLESINNILDMKQNYGKGEKRFARNIGIFKIYGLGNGSKTEFKDEFNICQYFPGYLRRSEFWSKLKDGHYTDTLLRELFYTFNNKNQSKLEF